MIYKLGSCRSNLLLDNFIKNPYTHSTKEVLQWLDILEKKIDINSIPYNNLIIKDNKKINYYINNYNKSNIIIIEISSLKIGYYNNYYYNINNINEYIKINIQSEDDLYNDLLLIINRLKTKNIIFIGHLILNFYDIPNFNTKYRLIIDKTLQKISTNKIILSDLFKNKDYKDIFAHDINHFTKETIEIITKYVKNLIEQL